MATTTVTVDIDKLAQALAIVQARSSSEAAVEAIAIVISAIVPDGA